MIEEVGKVKNELFTQNILQQKIQDLEEQLRQEKVKYSGVYE